MHKRKTLSCANCGKRIPRSDRASYAAASSADFLGACCADCRKLEAAGKRYLEAAGKRAAKLQAMRDTIADAQIASYAKAGKAERTDMFAECCDNWASSLTLADCKLILAGDPYRT